MNEYHTLYCDGSLQSACYVLDKEQPYIFENVATTHNQYEYLAVWQGVCYARNSGITHLNVLTDSELVVNQLNHALGREARPGKQYRRKDPILLRLSEWVLEEVPKFIDITFTWVPREENLAGIALEEHKKRQQKNKK